MESLNKNRNLFLLQYQYEYTNDDISGKISTEAAQEI